MNLKIENKILTSITKAGAFQEFILTLQKLKVGQSFAYPKRKSMSYFRVAISVTQTLLNIKIITRDEGTNIRIARVQ